jgi:SAM-dependent methyltransferase
MSFYQTVNGFVPLQWKIRVHNHTSSWDDFTLRIVNRIKGGLAIPPPNLIFLVADHRSAKTFLDSGRSASEAIRRILKKNALDVEQFGSVLDFGCGVGRIMRHWTNIKRPVFHGTDYNPALIDWCARHLKFGKFQVNTLSGKLPYEADAFDFIYAFSVFTHLQEPSQATWLNELGRVLKPGGYLYLTTHGENYSSWLSDDERAQFESGKLVVRHQHQSGSNVCAVFHPPTYVRENLAKDFIFVDFVSGGAEGDSMQDVYLLKKPN